MVVNTWFPPTERQQQQQQPFPFTLMQTSIQHDTTSSSSLEPPVLSSPTFRSEGSNTDDDNGTQRDVSRFLANELQGMSFQERNSAMEEMHGIVSGIVVPETPALIQASLQELDSALQTLPLQERLAGWDRAVASNSSLVHPSNVAFRLQFLRAERFDAGKAAQRMCKFMALLNIINADQSDKDRFELPTLQSFNPDELELLKEGNVQLLPARDAIGRRVIARLDHYGVGKSINSIVRKSVEIDGMFSARVGGI
jgi:hypothetical protein